ncbi:hypothetical protein [Nocardia farcinica]|uniref:hypothetical protein n=1 Tax=Nocardia farcinica TaxID=37329 RepID=UPI002454209B|nr:hypothetical protein [Nocardia farcinica]
MADKYIRQVAGTLTEIEATVASAGAANAGDIPALDPTGRFDPSLMPVGIGADTQQIQASEALAAGDFVNIHNAGGARVRKADASTAGKHAHGFVLAAVASGAMATVYLEATNTQVTSQTPGDVFLSTTPGLATSTPPSGAGQVVQRLGVATSATTVNFEPGQPIVLA